MPLTVTAWEEKKKPQIYSEIRFFSCYFIIYLKQIVMF